MSIVQFGAGVVVCSVACMVRYSNTDNCSPSQAPQRRPLSVATYGVKTDHSWGTMPRI